MAGVGVTPTTPFTDDRTGVDSSGRTANVTFLLGQGARLLYPANFAPRLALAIRALEAGDFCPALRLRATAAPFKDLRSRHGDAYNLSDLKAAMDEADLVGGPVRPPLSPIGPKARSEIRSIVEVMTA